MADRGVDRRQQLLLSIGDVVHNVIGDVDDLQNHVVLETECHSLLFYLEVFCDV